MFDHDPREIRVSGAREHNLKNVSLSLPRNRLVCFTGVSGSGKSSMAFDTLFAEGQRRYLESLSSYARQFLGQLAKPNVDRITGLSPAISIQQKTSGWNPRSTVGTVTQIHDYLRVLYARAGRQHCPKCAQPIRAQSREQILSRIMALPEGVKMLVLAPVVRAQKGEYRDLFEDLIRQGYARARVDGEVIDLKEPPTLARHVRHNIEVVVDRLNQAPTVRPRLSEAVEQALKLGEGAVVVHVLAGEVAEGPPALPRRKASIEDITQPYDLLLSAHYACPMCDLSFEPPSPQLFSFNSPTGMCPQCDGMGTTFDFDPELLVPDATKSFLQLAIEPMRIHMRMGRWRKHIYQGVADHVGFDLRLPWSKLPDNAKQALLFGLGDTHITFEYRSWGGRRTKHGGTFDGVLADMRGRHRKSQSAFMRAFYEQYMRTTRCPACDGARLNPQARAVRVGGKSIQEVSALSIADAVCFFDHLANEGTKSNGHLSPCETRASARAGPRARKKDHGAKFRKSAGSMQSASSGAEGPAVLTVTERRVAADVLKEIRGRLQFLCDVGLDYLSLDRTAPTLSGGESQRIRLAGQIGAGLVGVLYILDEPSIGLHPRDNERLLDSLKRLRDLGNTVVVVEHDEQTMRAADEIIDFGPGPGVRGGEVVAQGNLKAIAQSSRSTTARYLRGEAVISVPRRRPVSKKVSA